MGCLCSLLKSLTFPYPSPVQNLIPKKLNKMRILRKEGIYGIGKKESGKDRGNVNDSSKRDQPGEPNSYIIRSPSQITSPFPSMDEDENLEGVESSDNNERDGSKVLYRSSKTRQANFEEKSEAGSSITDASNFVDHNFPPRPTFVHRAPSLRHHHSTGFNIGSKSISSSVDCVSPISSVVDSSGFMSNSPDTLIVRVSSEPNKPPTIPLKKVTFCEHSDLIK